MQRFIFLFAFTFTSFLSQAQPGKGLDLNLFKDRNQTVKNAVAPGLFLVQQNFIAVDSAGQEYGFNNQDDFGTIYSIGIKVKEGLLLPSTFNTPGLLDSNFEPYRAGYSTRNSSIKTRGIDSLKYDNIDLASFNDQVPRINQANDDEYFGIKDYKSVTNGKLLLVYADDITKLDKETLKTNIIQVDELVWDDKGYAQPKNIVIGNKTLIGGIFFYEEVTFGAVTFEPVAFFENINGAWILKAIDIKQSPGGGLNPIDKKKKK
jgi:hypothetical protein